MRRAFVLLLAVAPAAHADFADHYAAKDDIGLHKSPRVGRIRVLVIPGQVDVPKRGPLDLDKLRDFFERDASTSLSFPGYYRLMSGGQLTIEATMGPLVQLPTCPFDSASDDCILARGDISTIRAGVSALRTAVQLSDQAGVDFSQFDVNGADGKPDGIVDGIVLATNIAGAGICVPIFSLNTGDNLAGGTGGPFIVDGVQVAHMAVATDRTDTPTVTDPERVALHEFGHALGLTDLYHEGGGSQGVQWTLMGSARNYGSVGRALDAESRRALGWADVRVVSGTESITLASTGAVVKLGMGQEYYLAEARGGTGTFIDTDIATARLAIYHVDWRHGPTPDTGGFIFRLLSCVSCNVWRPYIMNEQADGLFDLQFDRPPSNDEDLFRPGDVFAPSDDTTPFEAQTDTAGMHAPVLSSNWYDGTQSGIEVRDIVQNADGTITASFTAPPVADKCSDVACWPGFQCREGNCQAPELPAPPPGTDEGCGCGGKPGTGAGFLLALYFLNRSSRRRSASAR